MSGSPLAYGRFIVVEGIDGSGSTTQAERLVRWLVQSGTPAVMTCEPTSGAIGRLIRELLRAPKAGAAVPRTQDWVKMALLFSADRMDHLDSFILPQMAAGVTVVSDRYDLSTLAYQSATAPSGPESLPWLRTLSVHARRPDLTVVLDVPSEVAEARRRSRGGDPELYEQSALQARLAILYQRAEELLPGDRLVHVPATGSIDDVHSQVVSCVTAPI